MVLIAALGVAAALSACASDGSSLTYAGDNQNAYYDGFYGPFNGGYWGSAGDFRYFDLGAMRYRRDRQHHFRRDAANGYQAVQAQERPEHRRSPNRQSPKRGAA